MSLTPKVELALAESDPDIRTRKLAAAVMVDRVTQALELALAESDPDIRRVLLDRASGIFDRADYAIISVN